MSDQGLWFRLCRIHQGVGAVQTMRAEEIDWRAVYAKQALRYSSFVRTRKSLWNSMRGWIIVILFVWVLLIWQVCLIVYQHAMISAANSILNQFDAVEEISKMDYLRQVGIMAKKYPEISQKTSSLVSLFPGVVRDSAVYVITHEDAEGDVTVSYKPFVQYFFSDENNQERTSERLFSISPWSSEEYEEHIATRLVSLFEKERPIGVFKSNIALTTDSSFITLDVLYSPYIFITILCTLNSIFMMIASSTRSKQAVKPLGLVSEIDHRVFVSPRSDWMYDILDDRALSITAKWILNLIACAIYQLVSNPGWIHYRFLSKTINSHPMASDNETSLLENQVFLLFFIASQIIGLFPVRFIAIYAKHFLFIGKVALYSPRRAYFVLGQVQPVIVRHQLRKEITITSVSLNLLLFEIAEEAYIDSNGERRTRTVEFLRYSHQWSLVHVPTRMRKGDYITGEVDVLIPSNASASAHGLLPKFVWYLQVVTEADEIPRHMFEVCIFVKSA